MGKWYDRKGIQAAAAAVGGLSPILSGGLESTAGNAISALGNAVGSIPGPVGMIGGPALSLAGSLFNGLFGSKFNKRNIENIENNTNTLRGFTSDANTFDELANNIQNVPGIVNFSDSDIGSGGLFGGMGKVRRKARALREAQQNAFDYAQNSIVNNTNNLKDDQYLTMAANYSSLGGPLNMHSGVMTPFGKRFSVGGMMTSPLHSYGGDWSNGLTFINSGDTHEANPNDGVQMGTDQQGVPNLVEEGEVIWNNYVFSNRLRVPKAVREKYKLRSQKELTYADAVKRLQKASEERPNDPIEKRGLDATLSELAASQEEQRLRREMRKQNKAQQEGQQFAYGGKADWKYGLRGNIFDGLTQPNIIDRPGYRIDTPDWVAAHPSDALPGEYSSYRFTREFDAPTVVEPYGAVPTRSSLSGFGSNLSSSRTLSETARNAMPVRKAPNTDTDTDTGTNTNNKGSWLTNLRFIPALGAGLGVFSDLMGWTNKPDYRTADAILEASKGIRDVSYEPIGDYMAYTPFDRLFWTNQKKADDAALRRSILNTTSNPGTAMAGLLSAGYNNQTELGKLARTAEEFNLAQREKAATFNRDTNKFNAESALKANIANNSAQELRMNAALQAAKLRDEVDARVSANRSANLTNLFDNLGNIGWEEFNRNMVNSSNPLYNMNSNGVIKWTAAGLAMSEDARKEIENQVYNSDEYIKKYKSSRGSTGTSATKGFGGYLTIKNKKHG